MFKNNDEKRDCEFKKWLTIKYILIPVIKILILILIFILGMKAGVLWI